MAGISLRSPPTQTKIVVFDFNRKIWSDWVSGHRFAYPTWSRDGKYLYFETWMTDTPGYYRVQLGQTGAELVVDLKDLHQFSTARLRRLERDYSGRFAALRSRRSVRMRSTLLTWSYRNLQFPQVGFWRTVHLLNSSQHSVWRRTCREYHLNVSRTAPRHNSP